AETVRMQGARPAVFPEAHIIPAAGQIGLRSQPARGTQTQALVSCCAAMWRNRRDGTSSESRTLKPRRLSFDLFEKGAADLALCSGFAAMKDAQLDRRKSRQLDCTHFGRQSLVGQSNRKP